LLLTFRVANGYEIGPMTICDTLLSAGELHIEGWSYQLNGE
jgi:hypothetical protein